MSRRKRSRRNPSTRRSTSRRSSGSSGVNWTNAAIGAGAVYGLGAVVTLGMDAYAAMQGTGRSVYATDLANALAWPLVLASGGRMGIAPGGPVLVQSQLNPNLPFNQNAPGLPQTTAQRKLSSVTRSIS